MASAFVLLGRALPPLVACKPGNACWTLPNHHVGQCGVGGRGALTDEA